MAHQLASDARASFGFRSDYAGSPKVLGDYGFIADGFRGGLIDSDGTLAWLCFPRWSDPAIVAGMLGSYGTYQVVPEGRAVPGGRYEDGTLIWHSRWVTEDGIVDCRQCMAYPGESDRAIVLRRIEVLGAAARVVVRLCLAADYGRRPLSQWHRQSGRWWASAGDIVARWSGAQEARMESSDDGVAQLVLGLTLEPGPPYDLVLEIMNGTPRPPFTDPDACWRATEIAWRSAVPKCDDVVAGEDVRRSFAVLRGMTGPDGATVAAATTSLPERADAGRNYDYRFSWIRDTCYVGHAGAAVRGAETVLDDAVRWVSARLLADGERTMPAYLPGGEPVPEERPLGLPGYPGGCDVIGNRVGQQQQLDLFGEALVLLALAASRDRLETDDWRAAELAVKAIEKLWREPDSGIWEIEPTLWTHSRLICVAGLRAVAAQRVARSLAATALTLADEILVEVDRTSLHRSGRWQRAPDDERPDSSLLLAEVRGAVPADDPRSATTRTAIARELSRGGFLYRYRHHGRELSSAEGAFLICNFWMALACARSGDPVGSARWFERGRSACSTSGLFSEEYDVEQRQLRGNLPQAFVHALMIEAAAWQSDDSGVW